MNPATVNWNDHPVSQFLTIMMRMHQPDAWTRWYLRAGLLDPWAIVFFLVAAFLLGSCLGSFLNVCIWRMPLGESVVTAPSHCPRCLSPIRWYDNIPILSYTMLRGRCRACRVRISPRYLCVEALTGLLFTLLTLKVILLRQPPALALNYFTLTLLCVTTVWIDLRHRLIPDATTYPAMIAGLICAAVFPSAWGTDNHFAALFASLLSGLLIGGALALFAILGQRVAGRDVFGWGDVKFMAATAILLGLPGAIFTLTAAALAGTLWGLGSALLTRRKLTGTAIAFGPFLAAAALAWMFFGEHVLRWYATFSRLMQD